MIKFRTTIIVHGSGGSRPSGKGGREGGGWSLKKFFSALRASVWSTNKGGGEGQPPGPLPWSCHCMVNSMMLSTYIFEMQWKVGAFFFKRARVCAHKGGHFLIQFVAINVVIYMYMNLGYKGYLLIQ